MSRVDNDWQRWRNVIFSAEQLDLMRAKNPKNIKNILEILGHLEEVFSAQGDPVDDFEGFAIKTLCKSLKKSLEEYLKDEQVSL